MPLHTPSSTPLPPALHPTRIPSLDGLRALSILLVVALHTVQRISLNHRVSILWYGLFNGQAGVDIFFEISGFLITTLLLNEHQRSGAISLTNFYVRRAFRILPPLYLYIAIAVLLCVHGRSLFSWLDVTSSLFFFHNLYPGTTWPLEHLWSISLEEQFYLFWPFLLVFCLRRPSGNGRQSAAIIPIAVMLVSPLARVVLARSTNLALHFIGVHQLRLDFLMCGCLIALLQHTPRFEAIYQAAARWWFIAPGVLLSCNFLSAYYGNRFDLPIGFSISSIAIGMFMLWCTRNSLSLVGRVLNYKLVAWIGVLSYSLYLWQTLWLHQGNESVLGDLQWWGQFPQDWAAILLAGAGSYYLIEQPSLRLRSHLTGKRRAPALRQSDAAQTTLLKPR